MTSDDDQAFAQHLMLLATAMQQHELARPLAISWDVAGVPTPMLEVQVRHRDFASWVGAMDVDVVRNVDALPMHVHAWGQLDDGSLHLVTVQEVHG